MTYGGTCLVFIGNSSVLSRAERHIGRSLRFRWWVGVFNQGVLRTNVYDVRFYEFAYCFLNVSGRPAASSVRAAPCQLPRRGSFCTGLWGVGGYWERFRPFTCGTAHRPFPTVSLVGGRFQPRGSMDGRCGGADCGNNGRKEATSVHQKLSTVHCQLSISE